MRISLFIFAGFFVLPSVLFAQRYIDRAGTASFFSEAPIENIEAHNNQGLCIVDTVSGEVAVSLLMKSFRFEKALMQEHFNEKYVESDKFPKATFKGRLDAPSTVVFGRPGNYTARVRGDITIHGQTRPVETDVQFVVTEGGIETSASFPLRVKDFNIQIPSLVAKNIAEVITVKVLFNLTPYE